MTKITNEETLQILIVDDNVDFCMNCIDILEMKGHKATAVHDGFQTLDIIKEQDFDLVIMDIKMPVMNGYEIFKKLKEIKPFLPVIIVTAYAVEDLIRGALQEGALVALHKPLDFEKLFLAIDNARRKGTLILVVDDDEEFSANLSDVLTVNGFHVHTANDGETAVLNSMENYFDVIILDMKLPSLNGLETYLAIRAMRPSVVVILITGYMDEMKNIVEYTLDNSACVCLEKPLDMDQLLNILQQTTKTVLGESDS